MATMGAEVTIPKRQTFRSAEVCSIAGVQPYILKSWEAEFPTLARPRKKGGERVYRRTDVEMVLQIKTLVFGEGLTLGAARRKLQAAQDEATGDEEEPLLAGLVDEVVQERIAGVKQGLRDILEMLSTNGDAQPASDIGQPVEAPKPQRRARKTTGAKKASRRKKSA